MQARSGRILLAVLVVAALALSLGVISTGSMADREKISPHQLTVLFTGDDWGQVKNCE